MLNVRGIFCFDEENGNRRSVKVNDTRSSHHRKTYPIISEDPGFDDKSSNVKFDLVEHEGGYAAANVMNVMF